MWVVVFRIFVESGEIERLKLMGGMPFKFFLLLRQDGAFLQHFKVQLN